jgi:hypothetical protein
VPGRPRLYDNAAEKNRAYRDRHQQYLSEMDGWAEQATDDMTSLRRAVTIAQGRGDDLALSLRTAQLTDMMEDLAIYFRTGAGTTQAHVDNPTNKTKNGSNR